MQGAGVSSPVSTHPGVLDERGTCYRFDVEIAAMKTCDLFRLACEAGTRLVLVLDGPIRPQEPYWKRMEAAEEE